MRKLNVKLFLALVVGAVFLTGSVWGLHHFQYQRIAAALLRQARRAEEAGKVEPMKRYLERYLEFAPQDVEELAHLGRTLTGDQFSGSLAARRQAFTVLNKVLSKDASRRDLQRLLVRTALEIGEYSAARKNLEALSKTAAADESAAERGEREGYWGRLLETEKNPVEAMKYCRLALKDSPSEEGSYVRLAWLLRAQQGTAPEREQNLAEADQTINDLVASNPTSANAHLDRWHYRREFGLLDARGAQDAKLVPVDKAIAEDVDAALAQAPENVAALIAKADSELLLDTSDKNHRDKAYEYLQHGLKLVGTPGYVGGADTTEFDLLWRLSTLLMSDPKLTDDAQKTAEVEQYIARIRKTRGRPAGADYLDAQLLMHKKDWARAVALLEQTRPVLAAQQAHLDLIGQIDLSLGQCFEALEEWPQAEKAYKSALNWQPTLAQAKAGLGMSQRMLGRIDEALENLTQAAGHSQEPGKAWLEVARLEIMRQLHQDKRDWAKAESAIDSAAQAIPRDAKEAVQPALLRAEILALQEKWDDVEKLLKDARKVHPDRVEFWTALADVAGRRHKEKDALAILDEADAALGDRAELRISRAIHLAGDLTDANKAALESLVQKDHSGFSGESLDKLLAGLAEAEIRADRPAEAAGFLEELAGTPRHRTDLRLRLTLFDLALQRYDAAVQSKDEEEAKTRTREADAVVEKALAEIRNLEGSRGAFYHLGLAMRSVHLARAVKTVENRRPLLEEARQALVRAAELQPNWSAVELARADVSELNLDPEGMIGHLKEAVQLEQGRASPVIIQRLVEALNQQGRFADSAQYIATLRGSLLVNTPLARVAMGIALNTGDLTKARELIENGGVPVDPKNFRDLLLRARYREADKRDQEAEDDYRLATEVAPEEPVVWVAYIHFLGNHGKEGAAGQLITSSVAVKVPKDKAPLAIAQCYEVLSLAKEATAAYDAALAARPRDPVVIRATAAYRLRTGRAQDAVPLLDRMAKRDLDSPDADVEWARRALALILSGSPDFRDFRRAAQLVGITLDDAGALLPEPVNAHEESAEVRRARARVLATQPQRAYRARAIQLLEGLQSTDPDDQFVLALLYDVDGAVDREAEILKHLTTLDDRAVKPAYLSQYAQVLLHQGKSDKGRLDDALGLVGRLEKMETDRQLERGAYGTVELRARVLEAQDKGAQALESLQAHVSRRGAKPEDMLLLVASLARQKRIPEAFNLCDKEDLWKKCPPPVIAGVSVALLRAMPTADKNRDRIQHWLEDAIKANPKLTVLKLHLADLNDQRGQYDDAMNLYREVLKDEPGNVVALNNLASLLSLNGEQAKEGLKYIETAIAGMGQRADLLDTRGQVQLALGNTTAALTDFKEASTDAPSAARLFHLARAQYEARDRAAAQRTLLKAKTDFDLQPSAVHPTEQQVCQTLLNELKIR